MADEAAELLKLVAAGSRYGSIQLKDVEEILTKEIFTAGNMLTTTEDKADTLLHLAAQGKTESVLPLVVQAYKHAKVFHIALTTLNGSKYSPLYVAVAHSNVENAVFLFNECVVSCPQALEPREDDGFTLLHIACGNPENINILKFLLSQDICQSMLLAKWMTSNKQELIPVDVANQEVMQAQRMLDRTKSNLEFQMKHSGGSDSHKSFVRQSREKTMVLPKKQKLHKARELYSVIEQATMVARAQEAEKLSKEIEKTKRLEKEQKIISELDVLIEANNWSGIQEGFWLSEDEDTQKITINHLAGATVHSSSIAAQLPPLTVETATVLEHFLEFPVKDKVGTNSLELLQEFTKSGDNVRLLLDNEDLGVDSKVLTLLSSIQVDIQRLCAGVLVNLTCNKPESFVVPDGWIQPLLLIKHFSLDDTSKSLATKALANLGVAQAHPDPGTWTVREVSLWMESNTNLEKRSVFAKAFVEAEIDGLHLLELSATEMTALGVKFVSNQRKLSSSIDELRRMNMRTIVGQKDVFLSYSHINIKFAREIKKALNQENYSVWIDEAGIRAGQKWRNEIADGIHSCRALVFIMTPRSANSEYCQDELALAEEYKKPIVTVKLQTVQEMDPGMKLMVQRRQWIDFTDEHKFEEQCKELAEAVTSTIGVGSGLERDEEDGKSNKETHTPAAGPPENTATSPTSSTQSAGHLGPFVVEDLVKVEVAKMEERLREEMVQVQQQLQHLKSVVNDLATAMSRLETTRK